MILLKSNQLNKTNSSTINENNNDLNNRHQTTSMNNTSLNNVHDLKEEYSNLNDQSQLQDLRVNSNLNPNLFTNRFDTNFSQNNLMMYNNDPMMNNYNNYMNNVQVIS